ncbi:unnamed protein product [Soboliphyme baturini]|uniref:Uncharacterized protein n=1 Tax=Soboliphyme baturini TaxID=241478 RepID=A0A183J6S0_9BILA|nr:unnamed protein product [Soboliphyme baturini]
MSIFGGDSRCLRDKGLARASPLGARWLTLKFNDCGRLGSDEQQLIDSVLTLSRPVSGDLKYSGVVTDGYESFVGH